MLEVKGFGFSPFQENTYVIYNEEGQCCIVDPGCYFEEERHELKDFIEQKKLVPKYLLNTHCHLDHVFGAKFVYETWGLEMHFHEKDQIVFDHAEASGERWNTPFESYKGPVHYLREGESVFIGEDELKILFCAGSFSRIYCFLLREAAFHYQWRCALQIWYRPTRFSRW